MNRIKLHREYYQPVVDRKKISTIRKGRKDYQLGDAVLDFGDDITLPIYIESIKYIFYGLLEESHAIADGFESLEELQGAIERIYPDIETFSETTIVSFGLR